MPMDTRLYFEGELIDAATNKPVIKVVRQGEGKDLNNESTPMAFENIKQVIDDMATDATMFDVNKSSSRRAIVRWRFYPVRRKTPSFRAGI